MKWYHNIPKAYRNALMYGSFIVTVVFSLLLIFSEKPHVFTIVLFILSALFSIAVCILEVLTRRIDKEENEKQLIQKKAEEDAKNERWRRKLEADNKRIQLVRDCLKFPIKTKVVGVTHDDRQELISNCYVGEKLNIEHCPSDRFPEATEVSDEQGNVLGHINKNLAEDLVDYFGNYFSLEGEILAITGGGYGENYGCNIIIYDEE